MTTPDATPDMGRTTIQVSEELADELHDRKDRGDSYEKVIWRLIDRADDLKTLDDASLAAVEEAVEEAENEQVRQELRVIRDIIHDG